MWQGVSQKGKAKNLKQPPPASQRYRVGFSLGGGRGCFCRRWQNSLAIGHGLSDNRHSSSWVEKCMTKCRQALFGSVGGALWQGHQLDRSLIRLLACCCVCFHAQRFPGNLPRHRQGEHGPGQIPRCCRTYLPNINRRDHVAMHDRVGMLRILLTS